MNYLINRRNTAVKTCLTLIQIISNLSRTDLIKHYDCLYSNITLETIMYFCPRQHLHILSIASSQRLWQSSAMFMRTFFLLYVIAHPSITLLQSILSEVRTNLSVLALFICLYNHQRFEHVPAHEKSRPRKEFVQTISFY